MLSMHLHHSLKSDRKISFIEAKNYLCKQKFQMISSTNVSGSYYPLLSALFFNKKAQTKPRFHWLLQANQL